MNHAGVTLRRVANTPESIAGVQAVIEAAPEYSLLTAGAEPQPCAAASIFEALPPGKRIEDKHVLTICLHEKPIGVVDLIRGFPSPGIATLGLLLLADRHQGKGLGESAYKLVEQLVRTWPEVRIVRIGVVETNAKVLPYWQRMGFRITGETKPYAAGSVASRVVVLERSLQSAA